MGRFGEAHEIAKAAPFLASDDSSFMTASSLLVDGGINGAYTIRFRSARPEVSGLVGFCIPSAAISLL